jgi:hypothetical protein
VWGFFYQFLLLHEISTRLPAGQLIFDDSVLHYSQDTNIQKLQQVCLISGIDFPKQ